MKHAVTMMCEPDEVDAVNAHLERQGYGPNNVSVPVKGKGAAKTPVTGYMVDTVADDGLRASMEKMGRQTRRKRVIAETLDERHRKEREAKKHGKKSIRDQRLDQWNAEVKPEPGPKVK